MTIPFIPQARAFLAILFILCGSGLWQAPMSAETATDSFHIYAPSPQLNTLLVVEAKPAGSSIDLKLVQTLELGFPAGSHYGSSDGAGALRFRPVRGWRKPGRGGFSR
jgi:hypothetical protein